MGLWMISYFLLCESVTQSLSLLLSSFHYSSLLSSILSPLRVRVNFYNVHSLGRGKYVLLTSLLPPMEEDSISEEHKPAWLPILGRIVITSPWEGWVSVVTPRHNSWRVHRVSLLSGLFPRRRKDKNKHDGMGTKEEEDWMRCHWSEERRRKEENVFLPHFLRVSNISITRLPLFVWSGKLGRMERGLGDALSRDHFHIMLHSGGEWEGFDNERYSERAETLIEWAHDLWLTNFRQNLRSEAMVNSRETRGKRRSRDISYFETFPT